MESSRSLFPQCVLSASRHWHLTSHNNHIPTIRFRLSATEHPPNVVSALNDFSSLLTVSISSSLIAPSHNAVNSSSDYECISFAIALRWLLPQQANTLLGRTFTFPQTSHFGFA
jgi:hypothetical protein